MYPLSVPVLIPVVKDGVGIDSEASTDVFRQGRRKDRLNGRHVPVLISAFDDGMGVDSENISTGVLVGADERVD
jgi:hypothetical protein